jgi:hypothetical protein
MVKDAEGELRMKGAPQTMTNPQAQDLLDAFRFELDSRELAVRSRRTIQEALDASDRVEQAVASLIQAGHVIDADPLIRWITELRATLRSPTQTEWDALGSLLIKVRAIQTLPELVSSEQLAEAQALLERGERQGGLGARRRRSRPARMARLAGIDRRHLPFGIRVECDPCGEIVTGTLDRGSHDWHTVLRNAKDHNNQRHAEEWSVLLGKLQDALQVLVDASEARADNYVLLKR